MTRYVLDTSAIIAALKQEPDFEKVRDLLRAAERGAETELVVPYMALMEMQYRFMRDMSEDDVQFWVDVVRAWPIGVVESTADWGKSAARIKATAHVSLGDAWIAALALDMDATLVHKDPEFESVSSLSDLRLQYDRDAR
jgi:predicted nucleic acid-binding protein